MTAASMRRLDARLIFMGVGNAEGGEAAEQRAAADSQRV